MNLKADIVKALSVSLDREDSEHLAAEIMDRLPPVYAAAPEMLKALDETSEYLAKLDEMQPDRNRGVVGKKVRSNLQTVIKKAKGEKP